MMLRGAIGPQSLVIIQSEITDSESNVFTNTCFLPAAAAFQRDPNLKILLAGSALEDMLIVVLIWSLFRWQY